MSLLETFIEADRIVIVGLRAYDDATSRIQAAAREGMAENGHDADEIAAFIDANEKRIREGRGELHRRLWTRALEMIAEDAPTIHEKG